MKYRILKKNNTYKIQTQGFWRIWSDISYFTPYFSTLEDAQNEVQRLINTDKETEARWEVVE
jgi:hypothetical protein